MRTALLTLHYQNDTIHREGRVRFAQAADDGARAAFLAAAQALLKGARAKGVPVISVRIAFRPDYREVIQNSDLWRNVVASGAMIEGSWGAAFHEGLGPEAGEFVITHQRNDAFHGTPLDSVLRGLGVTRLVIAGVATTYSVESTVRRANDLGYEVILVKDACTQSSQPMHAASLAAMTLLATVQSAALTIAGFGPP